MQAPLLNLLNLLLIVIQIHQHSKDDISQITILRTVLKSYALRSGKYG